MSLIWKVRETVQWLRAAMGPFVRSIWKARERVELLSMVVRPLVWCIWQGSQDLLKATKSIPSGKLLGQSQINYQR